MSNTTENDDKKKKKPLTLSKPGKLELKKTVEGGQVRFVIEAPTPELARGMEPVRQAAEAIVAALSQLASDDA